MITIIKEPTLSKKTLKELQEEYPGYVKVVVDLKRGLLAAGGEYHVDCEQVLIKEGSKQSNLWGGGYNVETKEVDFFAMSNYRPSIGRVTYEISDSGIRKKFKMIVEKLLSIK